MVAEIAAVIVMLPGTLPVVAERLNQGADDEAMKVEVTPVAPGVTTGPPAMERGKENDAVSPGRTRTVPISKELGETTNGAVVKVAARTTVIVTGTAASAATPPSWLMRTLPV
jgi:hypothetical protein